MLTQEVRPKTFRDVAGQDLVKELLKSIVKKPEEAPKTIILQGEYGTGKTSCARIFSRALNCRHKTKDGDACGECDICKLDIDNSIYYQEFDSAMIGNVEDIKKLKETFYFNKELGYKVIVLDEAQLMTQQSQSALLKILEETVSGIFFVLCTTHIEKILPTIRSRSLKLRFDLINENDMLENLNNILSNMNLTIDNDILNLIVNRANGHLRDAQMFLDSYILLENKDSFKDLVKSSEDLYYKLIISAIKSDKDLVDKFIQALLSFPISSLKRDYENIVLKLIKVGLGVEKTDNVYINSIINIFRNNIFKFIDIINDNIIYTMFTSDTRFKTAMYILTNKISRLVNK